MWLDHITSSGLGLCDDVAGSQANRSLLPNQRERERDNSSNNGANATLHPLPGDHSAVEPPDPIPNSEVKRTRADGSVA